MTDRGIGLAGIAISVIFGILQFVIVQIPPWLVTSGIGLGVFMLGISFGLIWAGRRKSQTTKQVDNALLRLHVYRDNRVPDSLETINIFRWYYLSHIIMGKSIDGKKIEIELPTLFVTFEPEVRITSLKIRSPDMKLPRHEVKEYNQKYAIVIFSEKLREGTLEIAVES
jgi:hypothetical protein